MGWKKHHIYELVKQIDFQLSLVPGRVGDDYLGKKMFSLLSVKNAALKVVRIYLSQAFSTCFCSKGYCSLNHFLILKLIIVEIL